MTEQEKMQEVVNNEVTNGVDKAFQGSVRADFIETKIENTVEISGATAEAADLDISIDKLRSSITKTKVASIIVWILCGAVFIARFCMGGVL